MPENRSPAILGRPGEHTPFSARRHSQIHELSFADPHLIQSMNCSTDTPPRSDDIYRQIDNTLYDLHVPMCYICRIRLVGIHRTVCEGVDTKAVYGIGSTLLTPRYVTTQEANWGLHGPLLPYTNTRDTSQRSLTAHVLGKATVAALDQALIPKPVAYPECLCHLLRPCMANLQNMFRRYSRSS